MRPRRCGARRCNARAWDAPLRSLNLAVAVLASHWFLLQYENAEMATRAVLEGNMKKLDNAHTLLVNHYDDFDKYAKVGSEE